MLNEHTVSKTIYIIIIIYNQTVNIYIRITSIVFIYSH